MHTSDTHAAAIDRYLPTDGDDGRLVFFVRSLAPTTDNTTQTDCFDRLRRLADAESFDVAVRVWGDGICTHAPEMEGISEMLETITEIYSFSAESDSNITPFFDVQRVDSSLSGESFERVIPPHRTLLAYEGGTLSGVFPCRVEGQTYTPCDALAALEANHEIELFSAADAA